MFYSKYNILKGSLIYKYIYMDIKPLSSTLLMKMMGVILEPLSNDITLDEYN